MTRSPTPRSGVRTLMVVLIVALGLLVLSLGDLVVHVATLRGVEVEIPIEEFEIIEPQLISGVDWRNGGSVVVVLTNPDGAELTAYLLGRLPGLLMIGIVLGLLVSVLRQVSRGEVFLASIAGRIRAAGIVLALGSYVVTLLTAAADFWLSTRVLVEGAVSLTEIPAVQIVAGLGLVVVAEVVRHGARLREDLDGVV